LNGGATNEWQASRGASTHAKIYTGCWFLDHGYNLQTAEHFQIYIQRSLQIAKQQHESWQRTFGLSCPCLRLVLVQLEGKVEAVGTCKCCLNKKNSEREKENEIPQLFLNKTSIVLNQKDLVFL
jgi:hypothetical protein